MKTIKYSLLILCLAVLGFTGCSDTATTTTPTVARTYPKSGSSYTYTKTNTDGSGNPKAGTDSTRTATVVVDAHSFSSKDTVITYVETGGSTSDTTNLSYEKNGDVSLYRGNGIPGLPFALPIVITSWWQLPFVSGSAVTIINVDTNLPLFIGTTQVTIKKVVGTATKSGTENITVGTKVLSCQKTDVVFSVTAEVIGLGELPIAITTSYYYSTELGYFVKYVQTNDPKLALILGANAPSNYVQVLTAYSVK